MGKARDTCFRKLAGVMSFSMGLAVRQSGYVSREQKIVRRTNYLSVFRAVVFFTVLHSDAAGECGRRFGNAHCIGCPAVMFLRCNRVGVLKTDFILWTAVCMLVSVRKCPSCLSENCRRTA